MIGRIVSSNLGRVLGTLLVIGIAGSTVSYGTFATFTAQTTNDGNTFSTGTLTMTNVAGSVVAGANCGTDTYNGDCATLFNLSSLKPGAADNTNTVTLTYTGSLTTGSFGVYAANYVAKDASSNATLCTTATPSDKVNFQIKQGATIIYPTAGVGYGTLADFATTYPSGTPLSLKGGTNGSGAAGVWATNDNSVFTIAVNLDTTAGNPYQGCVSKVDLVWSAAQ
jgi:hypothetical protein